MKNCLVMALFAIAISFASCNNQTQSPVNQNTADTASNIHAATLYTCEMHPEVISEKPGKCPKCGMTLIKKEPGEAGSTSAGAGRTKVSKAAYGRFKRKKGNVLKLK